MCGIYGRIGPRDDELDRQSTLTLGHRGPDHAGLYVDTRPIDGAPGCQVALGHARLSILDLSPAGHQPMLSDDEETVIAYNGEVYNFQPLRAELQAQGVAFRSTSDTEVLLRLYERDGDAFLSRLAGMFALAIWDRRRGRLLLARDPSGIKPLYYRFAGSMMAGGAKSPESQGGSGPFAFASEPKALLRDPSFRREPDLDALAGYLAYLFVPPPRSAFKGIASLGPGEQLVWQMEPEIADTRAANHQLDNRLLGEPRVVAGEVGTITIRRFHRFSPLPKSPLHSIDTAADELDGLLKSVIAEHLIADVSVGAFLSGGIDSGLLVAMAAQHKRERGDSEPLSTFTIGFGEEGQAVDEVGAAAVVAKALGVAHRVIRVDGNAAVERFGRVVDQFDEPFGNPTTLLQDILCEGARPHVTIAISGDGGDEAFGGYPRHRATQIFGLLRRLPLRLRRDVLGRIAARLPERADAAPLLRRVRRLLGNLADDFPTSYRGWLTHYPAQELAALLVDPRLAGGDGSDPGMIEATLAEAIASAAQGGHTLTPLDQACLADVYSFMPDNVLRCADRMSMRHALELRVPYADKRVLSFGLSLRDSLRMLPHAAVLGTDVPGVNSHDASKRVLRHLAQRYLPEAISTAPKQGFVAPMGTWLNRDLRDLRDQATSRATLERRGLVRPEAVAAMRDEHEAGRRDRTWNLWSLVMLEDWYQRRIDRLDLPEISADQPCDVHVAR